MAPSEHSSPPARGRPLDVELIELVDAIVAAIDTARSIDVDRVRCALEPFGGSVMFIDELRLNGLDSLSEWCICGGEVQ